MKLTAKHVVLNLFFSLLVINAVGQDTLETVQYDMSHCVTLYNHGKKQVASTRETLDSLIRKDASEEFCIERLKDFDIERFSLLGINLNSGYCRVPLGLAFTTVKVDFEKKYIFEISYDIPIVSCRALSSYDLWVKVPSVPNGYTVEFVVSPKERN